MENLGLKDLVRKVIDGSCNSTELTTLIELMKKIAVVYLKYQIKTGKRILNYSLDFKDTELDELAVDCIAELFARDEYGRFIELIKYYKPKLENIRDADVLILTRRLVVTRNKEELARRIFCERDPEGWKIVRNVKIAIRKSKELFMFTNHGRKFVFYKDGTPSSTLVDINKMTEYLRSSKPPIPEDILYVGFIDIYNPVDKIPACVHKLLKMVYEQHEYQNFLPFNTVIRLLRRAFGERFEGSRANIMTPQYELETKELEEHICAVMGIMEKKITKRLQDETRATAYFNAIYDILCETLYTRKIRRRVFTCFEALNRYMPDLNAEKYLRDERNLFEYMVKVARTELRKWLMRAYGFDARKKAELLELAPGLTFRAYVDTSIKQVKGANREKVRIFPYYRKWKRGAVIITLSDHWQLTGENREKLIVPIGCVTNWGLSAKQLRGKDNTPELFLISKKGKEKNFVVVKNG